MRVVVGERVPVTAKEAHAFLELDQTGCFAVRSLSHLKRTAPRFVRKRTET